MRTPAYGRTVVVTLRLASEDAPLECWLTMYDGGEVTTQTCLYASGPVDLDELPFATPDGLRDLYLHTVDLVPRLL